MKAAQEITNTVFFQRYLREHKVKLRGQTVYVHESNASGVLGVQYKMVPLCSYREEEKL